MSRLPGRLPGRVDAGDSKHLAGATAGRSKGADSYVQSTRTSDSSDSPARVGHVALKRLRQKLSERELAVLASVDTYRYMSAAQIERLQFWEHASADTAARIRRRVLERLTAARLLARTERVIGGMRAGSAGFVYGIGPLGHRLLHDDGSRGRWDEPSLTFLDHTLAVADVAIEVTEASRRGGLDLLALEAEPKCWRRFTCGLGAREVLKPDLFLSVGVGDYEHRWFIEVDRGTESTKALRDKCQIYVDYRRSGMEQAAHEVIPRELWIVPTERRARQIDELVRHSSGLTSELFTVTVEAGFLGSLVGGEQ